MLALVAPSLAAQGFLKPDPRLDSTATVVRDDYLAFRDTLRTIDAASARLTRDLRSTSDALLLSRARAVRAACANALRAVDPVRQSMLSSDVTARVPMTKRTQLERSIIELKPALSRCVEEFTTYSDPGHLGEIRDAGARSAMSALNSSHKFEMAAEAYLTTLGAKIRPYGAGANPFAGRSN